MPSVSYAITVSPLNTIFQGDDTFTASLTRNSTPPNGAYPVSAVITFSKIHVWSTRYPYIKFGDYFTTDGLGSVSGSSLTVDCTSLDPSLLSVSSATITATVKGVGNNINAFDFDDDEVTLVVEYKESNSSSSATASSSSVSAGGNSTVTFSNSNLSSVYHTVTWSIGDYSYSKTTGYGASSTSYTIPNEWMRAIPNSTSGLGNIVVSTYSSDGF